MRLFRLFVLGISIILSGNNILRSADRFQYTKPDPLDPYGVTNFIFYNEWKPHLGGTRVLIDLPPTSPAHDPGDLYRSFDTVLSWARDWTYPQKAREKAEKIEAWMWGHGNQIRMENMIELNKAIREANGPIKSEGRLFVGILRPFLALNRPLIGIKGILAACYGSMGYGKSGVQIPVSKRYGNELVTAIQEYYEGIQKTGWMTPGKIKAEILEGLRENGDLLVNKDLSLLQLKKALGVYDPHDEAKTMNSKDITTTIRQIFKTEEWPEVLENTKILKAWVSENADTLTNKQLQEVESEIRKGRSKEFNNLGKGVFKEVLESYVSSRREPPKLNDIMEISYGSIGYGKKDFKPKDKDVYKFLIGFFEDNKDKYDKAELIKFLQKNKAVLYGYEGDGRVVDLISDVKAKTGGVESGPLICSSLSDGLILKKPVY